MVDIKIKWKLNLHGARDGKNRFLTGKIFMLTSDKAVVEYFLS